MWGIPLNKDCSKECNSLGCGFYYEMLGWKLCDYYTNKKKIKDPFGGMIECPMNYWKIINRSMRAIMDFRNPFIIEEELKDVRELIHLNEELLSEFPDDDDPALEFNLNYLKGLETELTKCLLEADNP